MKDHERLDLLKEIGGTKVYEERREESLKVMQETEGRRKRIEEVVGFSQLCNCGWTSLNTHYSQSNAARLQWLSRPKSSSNSHGVNKIVT